MDILKSFLNNHGWQIGLIAIASVVILGILKYTNVFNKLEKQKKKLVYFCITVGLSTIGACIYLLAIGRFSPEYIGTLSVALYAVNQTFYSIYDNTSLKDSLGIVINKAIVVITEYYKRESDKLSNNNEQE